MELHGHGIRGVGVDPETRCAHYDSARDVVAIRFPCCDDFFPCFRCHEAVADHDASRWPTEEFDAEAVLCGACGATLTVREYVGLDASPPDGPSCPTCGAGFDPGCADHHDRYFAV